MYKICSLPKSPKKNSTKDPYPVLSEILAKHKEVLHQLRRTNGIDEIKAIFLKNYNVKISTNIKSLESKLYLFLFHSLKSILDCSDIVLYEVKCDQIFGEKQDKYLWIRTLVSDPNHSSRFETNIVNLGEGGNKLEILNIFLTEGSDDFNFKREIVDIKMEDGVMYVELPEIKSGNKNTTKKVQLSGSSENNIFVRLPVTSQKAGLIEELNNPNSPFSVATDAIYFREGSRDTDSAKRSLHSANIRRIIGLLQAKLGVEEAAKLLPNLFSALFSEGMMLEVLREQEFKGDAGRRVIALAHNVNDHIDRIITSLQNGEEIKIKEGLIYLNGTPLELLNENKELFEAKLTAGLEIIHKIRNILNLRKKNIITAQATSFKKTKNSFITKEQARLKTSALHNLQVCFFEPILLDTILLHIKKEKIAEFMNFIKGNHLLSQTNQGTFLDIKKLSNRVLLLSGFFHGYPPREIEYLLQPKLRGKVICKPTINNSGKIQTRVIIIFDKPIHGNLDELVRPIFIQDELSAEKTFLDPRLQSSNLSPDIVPFIEKSKDGSTLDLIIDYDIWSYPDRKILFRFGNGVNNLIQYEDNSEIKTASDIPNMLLNGGLISTVNNSELLMMEFFETIMQTSQYETQRETNPDPTSILGRCILNKDYRRSVLIYFIRNHITDPKALQLEPLFLRILCRYLILTTDDAVFAIQQIQGHRDISSLKDNSFLQLIKKHMHELILSSY